MRGWFASAQIITRFLQFAFSLTALIMVSVGFVPSTYYGYGSMLGSSSATFVTLITYSGMVYGLFALFFLELWPLLSVVSLLVRLIVDALLSILLLIAAIVFLTSDYVNNCSVYGFLLRCRCMRTAVVFTFLAMGVYLISVLLDLCGIAKQGNDTRADTPSVRATGGEGRSVIGGTSTVVTNSPVGITDDRPYHSQATPKGRYAPSGNNAV